jgi:general secretion pathway protein C
MREVRFVPEVRDGVPFGLRLFAVRPDGPFASLGLRNGDIVRSVNGISLTSPDSALKVYATLKVASHLSVTIDREGCPFTIEVSVQ